MSRSDQQPPRWSETNPSGTGRPDNGGTPQTNGTMWLLAGSPTAKTLQEINLVSGKIGHIVPVGADADSLVESSTGILAVGYSGASGPIEFRDSVSGALLHSVTVGTPVKELSAGADGTTFYALVGTPTEISVTTVSSAGAIEPPTFGVAVDTVSLAVSSTNDQLYLLESSGRS